jgi:hypothetical protein
MMLEGRMVAVAAGKWGPFRDVDETTGEVTTREIPWVDLAAEDGSGTRRAVVAEGQDSPTLFAPFAARVELYEGGGKLKLRFHGPSQGAAPVTATA